jgi:mannuronan 5-epimerase
MFIVGQYESHEMKAVILPSVCMRKLELRVLLTMICLGTLILLPVPLPLFLLQGTFQVRYVDAQNQQRQDSGSSPCVLYDSTENAIRISCKTTNLDDISNQLQNPDLLHKESTNGVWLLNAGVVIEEGATFYINSTDTSWLKIAADGGEDTAHAILVLGSLKIDSVKISSWDPAANDYVKFKFDILPSREYEKSGIDAVPRPYILVEEEATGTTDITNSELAYLGYTCGGGCSGLTYYGGQGSIVKGNEIHHNRFGFYSKAVGGLMIEDNNVHHNFMYGFDPHSGSHDMVIRNNKVHDHGAMGIICSVDCYNIVIDSNEVYRSAGSGIMFSRNMYDSIARNNNVHDEDKCIFVSQSINNKVYDNNVSNCETGIDIFHDSDSNAVYNNTITNSTVGIGIEEAGTGIEVHSNTIYGATEKAVNIEDSDIDEENTLKENEIINTL